jgi:hypothetical protein
MFSGTSTRCHERLAQFVHCTCVAEQAPLFVGTQQSFLGL